MKLNRRQLLNAFLCAPLARAVRASLALPMLTSPPIGSDTVPVMLTPGESIVTVRTWCEVWGAEAATPFPDFNEEPGSNWTLLERLNDPTY